MIAFTKETKIDGVSTIGIYRDGFLIGKIETYRENALALLNDGGTKETKGRDRTEQAKKWVEQAYETKVPRFIR